MSQEEILQKLARKYLSKLKADINKIGLGNIIDDLIEANKRGECRASKEQVDQLSRAFEEDEIKTSEIPEELGMSYRKMLETKKLREIRIFKPRGRRSRVDVEILKDKLKNKYNGFFSNRDN